MCVDQADKSIVPFHRAFHLDNRVYRGEIQFVLHPGRFAVFFGPLLLFGTQYNWVIDLGDP